MARLGLKVGVCCAVGDDIWGDFLAALLEQDGVDTSCVIRDSDTATSATAVLVGDDGEHTFAYYAGASSRLNRDSILDRWHLFTRADYVLLGYYSLMPELEDDLPELLPRLRAAGCRTGLDAAAGGGSMDPLDRILPHLDFYLPSHAEGQSQTGLSDPQAIIAQYRRFCRDGLLGVKLGEHGAVLSPADGEFLVIAPVEPPEPVIDTTGAGDSFYAGLIAGLVRGLTVDQAGRLAAAAGACSVTRIGASAGLRSYRETCALAGLE
jgi:sugar/nucleoside kinase (ribokinase family)